MRRGSWSCTGAYPSALKREGKWFVRRNALRIDLDQPGGFDAHRRPAMTGARAGIMDGCGPWIIGDYKAAARRIAVANLEQRMAVTQTHAAILARVGSAAQLPLA